MKKTILFSAAFALSVPASACITCNRAVQDAIFNSTFYPNLGIMLSAFFVLAAVVAALSWAGAMHHKRRVASGGTTALPTPVPMLTAAMILGIGLGGFADGIVLHQILQWHNMLSAKLPPDTVVNKSVNMFWDGVFHAFTLLVTLIGVVRLWRAGKRADTVKSGYLLSGGMLQGWGIFNLIEGVIDHQILNLHNVREISDSPQSWNIGFLVFSVLLILIGTALVRRSRAQYVAGRA